MEYNFLFFCQPANFRYSHTIGIEKYICSTYRSRKKLKMLLFSFANSNAIKSIKVMIYCENIIFLRIYLFIYFYFHFYFFFYPTPKFNSPNHTGTLYYCFKISERFLYLQKDMIFPFFIFNIIVVFCWSPEAV